MRSFTVSLGQMQCDFGNVEGNEEKILAWLKNASEAGSSLLVTPELSLTGYGTFAGIEEKLDGRIAASLERIREETGRLRMDLLVGYPMFEAEGAYIISSYIASGKTLATHKKVNLCNYAHYTEHLHFVPGDSVTCVDAETANFGIIICEDSWHVLNAVVASQLGAEILINPSAASVLKIEEAPSCLDNWKKISIGTAFMQTSYFIFCNQAGPSADGFYMGGSHVVDPSGNILGTPMSTDEGILHVAIDAEALAGVRSRRPLIENERIEIYSKYCIR